MDNFQTYPVFDDYEYDNSESEFSESEESNKELSPSDIERERLLSELMKGAYE